MRLRPCLLSLLLLSLIGCSTTTPAPPTSGVAQVQLATPALTQVRPSPEPPRTLPSTPRAPRLLPTPSIPVAIPVTVPARLAAASALTLTVERAAADPAFVTLPDAVRLVMTGEDIVTARQLVIVDSAGTPLVSPTDDLERLGWCSQHHDAFAPTGSWSANGRYLLASCQGPYGDLAAALLDLDQGLWLRFTPPLQPLRYDATRDVSDITGYDDVDLGPWLRANDHLLIEVHSTDYPDPEQPAVEMTAIWRYSLHDTTLEHIADFDEGVTRMTVSDDQRHLVIVGHRTPHPRQEIYVWSGDTTMQQYPIYTVLPFTHRTDPTTRNSSNVVQRPRP